MSDAAVFEQLTDINTKLDFISGELEAVKRQRQELEDLKADLTLVARDLFGSAIEELEDVAPFVNTGDFLHLVKKGLRNTNTITGLIAQLESAIDFYADAQPLAKHLFNDTLEHLDKLDRRGYFVFIRELATIIDNVVTHFDPADVKQLADNIVIILETVKSLTQPEMLVAVNNAVKVFQNLDSDKIEEYSIWKTLKELNTPEMKRGMGFIITFLKNIGDSPDLMIENNTN